MSNNAIHTIESSKGLTSHREASSLLHLIFRRMDASPDSNHVYRLNVWTFDDEHITYTKRLNGTVRLNFKNRKVDAAFYVDGYALKVGNETREALKCFFDE